MNSQTTNALLETGTREQARVVANVRTNIALKLIATCFALVMLLCFGGGSAWAQGLGTVVGTVTDSTGAVIPNATVKVVNEGTQISREVQTNAQGYFVIPSLDPAVYTLTIAAGGFDSYKRKGVTLLADQSRRPAQR